MRKSITEILSLFPNNSTIIDAVIKTEDHINKQADSGGKIIVSVSGGSDSDIMIDMFERIGYPPGLVVYVWFDTGLEYQATKRHLCDLEQKYGIQIQRRRPAVSVPLAVKRHGVPFISKMASESIGILQNAGFNFRENSDISSDFDRYKNARKGIRFWHSANESDNYSGTHRSDFDIKRFAYLKEFITETPPSFRVSSKCCYYAKKSLSKKINMEFNTTLSVIGVRKAEGGVRAAGNTCYTCGTFPPIFRPLFWMSDADKAEYKSFCGVRYSDCYEIWGFKRTGCVGCPFNSKAAQDLDIVEQYEPLIVKACRNIFGPSYEYRAQYNAFKAKKKAEKRNKGQMIMEGFFGDQD